MLSYILIYLLLYEKSSFHKYFLIKHSTATDLSFLRIYILENIFYEPEDRLETKAGSLSCWKYHLTKEQIHALV
ncbi:hypothetical protein J2S17_000600 [Cytobacillus purgationiresistens]|uniref:Uncharacterized protein n=1 Tax=Cytobacillus purgationiresistens TaxID=863449 RepID=A0ABU0ADC8_9BACI|nr:hypothetical protein [Cytobacillus purgationiresistens]